MSSSRLVRGAKTRMFAFVCLISVLGAVLYVFHGTQARLAEVQSQASQCNQQKESFNAQLQVIHEYKERLEKSLYKEKDDRKQDKDNHERELNEAKEKWERETLELRNKYEALDQKSKLLQAQLEDQKEASDKALSKVQNEKNNLETTLAETKTLLEETQAKLKESDNSELKAKFITQKEELKKCRNEVEDLKGRLAPESERKDYLTKQNDQLKAELEMAKHELAQCKDKLTIIPRPASSSPRNDRIDPPESNVDMPKLMGKNISSTPGINPDAVGESSSVKPSRDLGESKKEEEQVGLPPKKPTQESVAPLAQPKKFDDNPPPQGQAQIPGPPDSNPDAMKPIVEDTNDLSNINLEEGEDLVHQQESKAQLQQPQFINPVVDPNRAEEEEEQQPGVPFKQPGRNPDHYHGGDYDKEQAEEEDDEGEQIDYEGDRSMKEGRPRLRVHQVPGKLMESRGVMINPNLFTKMFRNPY